MPYKIRLIKKDTEVTLKYADGKSFFVFTEKSPTVTIDHKQLQNLALRLKPLTEQKILHIEEFSPLPEKEPENKEGDEKKPAEAKPPAGKPFQKKVV